MLRPYGTMVPVIICFFSTVIKSLRDSDYQICSFSFTVIKSLRDSDCNIYLFFYFTDIWSLWTTYTGN